MCIWQPVANKLYQSGCQSHAKIAGDWRLCGYNLHATGGHLGTYNLNMTSHQSHAIFEGDSGQHCAKPLVFWKLAARTIILVNNEMRKSIENLRTYGTCTSQGISINSLHVLIWSHETAPLKTSQKSRIFGDGWVLYKSYFPGAECSQKNNAQELSVH
jgi:hypothetical protein